MSENFKLALLVTIFVLSTGTLGILAWRGHRRQKQAFERNYMNGLKKTILGELGHLKREFPGQSWTADEIRGLSSIGELLDAQDALRELVAEGAVVIRQRDRDVPVYQLPPVDRSTSSDSEK